MNLNEAELELLRELLSRATPGVLEIGVIPFETSKEAGEWFARSLENSKSPETQLRIIVVATEGFAEDPRQGLVLAILGCGPNAANNARLFSNARPAIEALLEDPKT